MNSSRVFGALPNSDRSARGRPTDVRRLPGLDMIDTRLRTRLGCRMVIVWATIPPSDTPSTCARAMPSASSRPAESSAMSTRV